MIQNQPRVLFCREIYGVERDFSRYGRFVNIVDAGKIFDFAAPRLIFRCGWLFSAQASASGKLFPSYQTGQISCQTQIGRICFPKFRAACAFSNPLNTTAEYLNQFITDLVFLLGIFHNRFGSDFHLKEHDYSVAFKTGSRIFTPRQALIS